MVNNASANVEDDDEEDDDGGNDEDNDQLYHVQEGRESTKGTKGVTRTGSDDAVVALLNCFDLFVFLLCVRC